MRVSLSSLLFSMIATCSLGAAAHAGVAPMAPDPTLLMDSKPSPAGLLSVSTTPAVSSQIADDILPVHGADLPGFPAINSATAIRFTPRDTAQDLPVEPIPAPTAVSSGLAVLGFLAAFRLCRRIRFA